MDIRLVMTEVAQRLDTIDGLRVHDGPPGSIVPPAAVVTYPLSLTYDATYGRGMDTLELPVVVSVGRPTDRVTPDLLALYANGSGAKSVKQVLETGEYDAFDGLRVVDAEFVEGTVGGVEYMNIIFTVSIWGQGAGEE